MVKHVKSIKRWSTLRNTVIPESRTGRYHTISHALRSLQRSKDTSLSVNLNVQTALPLRGGQRPTDEQKVCVWHQDLRDSMSRCRKEFRFSDPSEGKGLTTVDTVKILEIILQHVFPVTHLTSHVTIISRSWCMEFWDPSRCLASLAFPSVPSDFLQPRLVIRSQKTWQVPPLDMIYAVHAGRLWSTEELDHSFASVVESYRSAGVRRSDAPHFQWYHIS